MSESVRMRRASGLRCVDLPSETAVGSVPAATARRQREAVMADVIDCSGYRVTDPHFGTPSIDLDEWRETPHPHRHVHGGFADCDARFTFYLPAADEWQGRLILPLEGAPAGDAGFFRGGPRGPGGGPRAV